MKKIKLITYKIVFVIPLLLWNINFISQCVDNGNIEVVIDTCADGNNIGNLAYKHIMEYKCNNIKFYYIMNTEYIHLSLSLWSMLQWPFQWNIRTLYWNEQVSSLIPWNKCLGLYYVIILWDVSFISATN